MLLGKPMDHEDIVDQILEGLGSEYQSVIDNVNGRDDPISLAELHEKLLTRETDVLRQQPTMSSFPVTANVSMHKSKQTWRNNNNNNNINNISRISDPSVKTSKPYKHWLG